MGAEGGERILSRICAELDPDLAVQGSRSHDPGIPNSQRLNPLHHQGAPQGDTIDTVLDAMGY